MTFAERMASMNNPAWNTEHRRTIPELWKETVSEAPDTAFLHFLETDEKYTYAEFDVLSNRLAHGLVDHGVQHGDRIATLLDSHADSVALLIAASKINAIYVPINTANKGEFLKNPLGNSGASVLITEDKFVERVKRFELGCLICATSSFAAVLAPTRVMATLSPVFILTIVQIPVSIRHLVMSPGLFIPGAPPGPPRAASLLRIISPIRQSGPAKCAIRGQVK